MAASLLAAGSLSASVPVWPVPRLLRPRGTPLYYDLTLRPLTAGATVGYRY